MAVYRYFQIDNWDRVERIPIVECGAWLMECFDKTPKEITRAEYIAYTRGYAKGLAKRSI